MKYLLSILRVTYFLIWVIAGMGMFYFAVKQYYSLFGICCWIHGWGFAKMFDFVWNKEEEK